MVFKKKNLQLSLLIGAIMVLTVVVSFLFLPGLNSSSSITRLTVHRGTGFRTILDELRHNGTIAETWPPLLTASIVPKLRNIKPGRYIIPPGMSNFGLMYYLHSRPQDEVRVTLPEGLGLSDIARILSKNLDIDSTGFMAAASDRTMLLKYGITASNAEGYLFPGTYHFAWASTPHEAAVFLVGRFHHFYTDSLKNVASKRGLKTASLLTLASIVEAETPLDAEKPVVASVYLNRLKTKMRLQADTTVQYALGGTARRLYYKDLEADSPYNTYRYNGLPPGPICNPGAASILAVLNPTECRFLYFVATGKGGHYFAESLAEHAANIKKYRKVRLNTLP